MYLFLKLIALVKFTKRDIDLNQQNANNVEPRENNNCLTDYFFAMGFRRDSINHAAGFVSLKT